MKDTIKLATAIVKLVREHDARWHMDGKSVEEQVSQMIDNWRMYNEG